MPGGQMMDDGKPPDDVKTPEIIEALDKAFEDLDNDGQVKPLNRPPRSRTQGPAHSTDRQRP
jgi:hypothetical protein